MSVPTKIRNIHSKPREIKGGKKGEVRKVTLLLLFFFTNFYLELCTSFAFLCFF